MHLPSPDIGSVIALDVGTKGTGVAVAHDGSIDGVFTLWNDEILRPMVPVRMAEMIGDVLTFQGPFNLVLWEDYGYGSGHFNSDQAEIIGVLKRLIHLGSPQAGIPVAPNTIKRIVAGNAAATKAQMSKALSSSGYSFESPHEADAVGVLLAYRQLWRNPLPGMFHRAIIKR